MFCNLTQNFSVYNELAEIIKKHMEPTPNVMLERYKFKKCVQQSGDDIKTFVEKLNAFDALWF